LLHGHGRIVSGPLYVPGSSRGDPLDRLATQKPLYLLAFTRSSGFSTERPHAIDPLNLCAHDVEIARMRRIEPAIRPAWAGLCAVLLVSAVALAWHPLRLPALIADIAMCVGTVAMTSQRLRQLREQAALREYDSMHDPVTELPNRTLFHQRALPVLAAGVRRSSLSAIMLLDLDRFKEVNDTLGHHQGDLLLHEVAVRIGLHVRPSDVIARLGGDEFAVLAADVSSREDALLLAERLREAVSAGIELAGVELEVEPSIGIALCPDHGDDSEDLLCHADVAMYTAKRQHTGVEIYSAETDESSRAKLGLLADLRRAIAAEELVLHFQPKAEASTGSVMGFEALVRWQHPEYGLLFPDEFIPLAENTGLMRPLTSYVLDRALAQIRLWRDAGNPDISVAVNISTRNLLDGAFPGEVRDRLAKHGLPASALELEITETTLMVDPVRAKAVIEGLADLGVGLAIDDFGTGYTSLSWLGELPVTTLKIDKSFVMDMASHDDAAAIVRSSVHLGADLGLRVVAEGVEDQQCWTGLADLGCDYIQGYFLSRPQPADVLDRWLSERRDSVTA
jgi:diguanylate cyclase (GGDEF)-like protein